MLKFTKITCLFALCSGLAFGCGDGGDDGKGSEGTVEGCANKDDDTCSEGANQGLFCESFGGVKGPCSKDNLEGTCAYKEDDGTPTTIYYYKGDQWDDDMAKGDCEDDFYKGTYTNK
ncbi:MAG: hypothetical protein QM778_23260 [Myxococcales bacterium]